MRSANISVKEGGTMEQNRQKPAENRLTLLDAVQVLSTKLYIPPVRMNAVTRPPLIERLMSGVGRPGCFSLLSGPAGFGKTTLLSEFVSQLQELIAWVSLVMGTTNLSASGHTLLWPVSRAKRE
jgi:predicted ATP-dependent serine protease